MAICGTAVQLTTPLDLIHIDGVPIRCALIDTSDDRATPLRADEVRVQIKAFSCNYRDRSLMLLATLKGSPNSFYVIGSDFVGEVIERGANVERFHLGDRVMGDNFWIGTSAAEARPAGIPSNHASREYNVFHQDKLLKIPDSMPDAVAAAFSIGAQTAYSMIRKLQIKPGARVLVTSAKSNTTLFILQALRKFDIQLYATSTSMTRELELKKCGIKELIQIDSSNESFMQNVTLREIVAHSGAFDYVIDPFFNLHLMRVIDVMAHGAKYISCGLAEIIHSEPSDLQTNLYTVIVKAVINNIQIIGNCLGLTEDLQHAIADYSAGYFNVIIDSVFSGQNVGAFLERTYNTSDRFGKVVYCYE